MKFIGRKAELDLLEKDRLGAERGPARMTVVTGRRRVGKTKLILRNAELSGVKTLYWAAKLRSEGIVCQELAEDIREKLGFYIPPQIQSFRDLFEILMNYGKQNHFIFIIDEFQDLQGIYKGIFADIRDVWDRTRDQSHVHLILSGSSFTMMKKIFEDDHEPLFGRAQSLFQLQPFNPNEIIEAFQEIAPHFETEDLLSLYTYTGGVPLYVADMFDNNCFHHNDFIEHLTAPKNIFIHEGSRLVQLEIGADSANYLSLLQAIAFGKNKASEAAAYTSIDIVSSYLERLAFYNFIERTRPVFSKPGSRDVRWHISDPFLRFWFRYYCPLRDPDNINDFSHLAQRIRDEYTTFSGPMLERWFREKLMNTGRYSSIGSWWDSKKGAAGAQDEIDIVAEGFNGKVLVAEIKRREKNINYGRFLMKVEHLRTIASLTPKANGADPIETRTFTLDDMMANL